MPKHQLPESFDVYPSSKNPHLRLLSHLPFLNLKQLAGRIEHCCAFCILQIVFDNFFEIGYGLAEHNFVQCCVCKFVLEKYDHGGIVCAYHPPTPGSSPKHTVYAFIIVSICAIFVM